MYQRSTWLNRVSIPKAFPERSLEIQFRQEYRAEGRIVTIYAFILGGLLALASFLLVESGLVPSEQNNLMQSLRFCAILTLASAIWIMSMAPEFSLRHYSAIVGVPVLIASLVIGCIAYLNSVGESPGPGRFLVAYVVFVWLCFSFTRLQGWLALVISCLAAVPVYFSAISHYSDDRFAVLMYLLVANAVGWISYVQIESRERTLFMQSRRLIAISSQLESQIEVVTRTSIEKERILHRVVHDLKQPLVSLAIHIAHLRQASIQSEPQCHKTKTSSFEKIDLCLSMASESIEDLLNNNKALHADISPVMVVPMIDRLTQVHEVIARSVGVRFLTCIRIEPICEVNTDRRALEALLTNLLSNAVKFSAARQGGGGLVFLGVIAIGDMLRIDVCDNGLGVSESDKPRMFHFGFRGKNAVTSGIEGRGIGLASARDIWVRLPGHSIEIASRIGEGCRARIRIRSQR